MWDSAGGNVIPIKDDGTKAPALFRWKPYQIDRSTEAERNQWFGPGSTLGIGVVTGAVSGNLEMLELEGRAVAEGYADRLASAMEDHGLSNVWETITTGYVELSPGGGPHCFFRVGDGPAAKNTKLARRPATEAELIDDPEDLTKVLIETRGEGGYVVVAPSGGTVHETGRPWAVGIGSPMDIPTITADQRDALYAVCSLFDQMPVVDRQSSNGGPFSELRITQPLGEIRPGDDYNQRADWRGILEPHGWTCVRPMGNGSAWRRPGKRDGISATTGQSVDGVDRLYVFSTSTVFEAETPYSKFAAYALLEHGGDYSVAAKALRVTGYGGAAVSSATSGLPAEQRTSDPVAGHDASAGDSAAPTPYQDAVQRKAAELRLLDQARAHNARLAAEVVPPPAITALRDFLAEPDEPVKYRIDGMLPVSARAILTAQYKAGKSSMIGNLVRSLVDEVDFLDHFPVAPFNGSVVLIDDELAPRTLRRWLRDQGVENVDRVHVVPLRGRVAEFNLIDPTIRARWVTALREAGVTVLIFDCLRPVLDALGLSEDKDAGRFLVAFDALLAEAEIEEAVIAHHMGHNGERARGDSRLRDWPDVEWRIVRQTEAGEEPDPAAPRFLSAFGRDVDVPEGSLMFDPATRHLTYSSVNRKQMREAAALPEVLAVLTDTKEPMSQRAIEAALAESRFGRQAVRDAVRAGRESGEILTEDGDRRAILHFLNPSNEPVRQSAPPVRQHTADECASAPLGGARRTQPAADLSAPAENTGALRCAVPNCDGTILLRNGRTICARRDPDHDAARAVAAAEVDRA